MDKVRFNHVGEFAQWMEEYPNGHCSPSHIRDVMKSVDKPVSYPVILVFSIENDSDDGLFVVSECVYPDEFE
jgi:hypothetical protein